MTASATRLRALAAVGPANGLRVLAYRLALKLGVHPVQRIHATIPDGAFFEAPIGPPIAATIAPQWRDSALLFSAHPVQIDTGPPTWTADPLSGEDGGNADLPWWRIGDFATGDIKRVWEFSRFDWAMTFAQRARNGDAASLDRLNGWIADWARHNPPYRGPNWKCAQEASIRLLHLSIAAIVLGQERHMPASLQALLDAHVRRIVPTLSYARAQENNHATSEAAALFVAGAWLGMAGKSAGEPIARKGRRLLEQHVGRLFAPDGSFSQYSLNYHRVALDTLAIAELWRRRAGLAPFSPRLNDRAAAAADWLRIMVDPETGDAPNLGANDGANLLPLIDAPYRDHRASVQLASALFRDAAAYERGPWDGLPAWLGIERPAACKADMPAAAIFDDGGYAVLRRGRAMALLRYPRFRFRPSQADALHVDFWLEGKNLLRDGGSFSYNTDARWIDYFGGVASHNTVQFDHQPQMPRVSRFLLGDWLTTDACGRLGGAGEQGFHAVYRHRKGWVHRREVHLGDTLRVIDEVSGFSEEARLRWRLAPGHWVLDGSSVTNGDHCLSIEADVPIASVQLITGYESPHYLEKSELPVLEVTITEPGRIVSEYRWAP